MTSDNVDKFRADLRKDFQAIAELADYLGPAERALHRDPAEWHSSLIRALADLIKSAEETEHKLSAHALETKALTPTQVSRAARITRNAVYKRIAKSQES